MTPTKMRKECLKEGKIWAVTVSGDPIGYTVKDDSKFEDDLQKPGMLPTEQSANRVARAFKGWIRRRFPGKEEPHGQYFVAMATGPCKVWQSKRPDDEAIRRKNFNFFNDQGEAHTASEALAWLCKRERERFEDAA